VFFKLVGHQNPPLLRREDFFKIAYPIHACILTGAVLRIGTSHSIRCFLIGWLINPRSGGMGIIFLKSDALPSLQYGAVVVAQHQVFFN
jgi:hypothetical protein